MGDIEIVALRDSVLPLRLDRMFPDTALTEFAAFRERYPGMLTPDLWITPVRAFVIRSSGWSLLFDSGIGTLSGFAARYDTRPALLDELRALALSPERIETVVLSHIHLDHAGGVTRQDGDGLAAVFPRARHYLHPADLALARGWAAQTQAYARTILELEQRGLLADSSDGHRLNDAVSLLHTPGHTPGSTSALVLSRREGALLTADAVPNAMLVTEPGWRFSSDHDHARAFATRLALMDRVEREGLKLVPTHMPEPFGGIVRVAGKRYWRGG